MKLAIPPLLLKKVEKLLIKFQLQKEKYGIVRKGKNKKTINDDNKAESKYKKTDTIDENDSITVEILDDEKR